MMNAVDRHPALPHVPKHKKPFRGEGLFDTSSLIARD